MHFSYLITFYTCRRVSSAILLQCGQLFQPHGFRSRCVGPRAQFSCLMSTSPQYGTKGIWNEGILKGVLVDFRFSTQIFFSDTWDNLPTPTSTSWTLAKFQAACFLYDATDKTHPWFCSWNLERLTEKTFSYFVCPKKFRKPTTWIRNWKVISPTMV